MKLTCNDGDLSFDSGSYGISSYLFKFGDVFEGALVADWSYELLTESFKSPFCYS